MFYIYVLRNKLTGKIYIGQTENLSKRLQRHNKILPSNKKSYTSVNKGEWVVCYQEMYNTRREAMVREKYLKSHIGRDWLREKLGT